MYDGRSVYVTGSEVHTSERSRLAGALDNFARKSLRQRETVRKAAVCCGETELVLSDCIRVRKHASKMPLDAATKGDSDFHDARGVAVASSLAQHKTVVFIRNVGGYSKGNSGSVGFQAFAISRRYQQHIC